MSTAAGLVSLLSPERERREEMSLTESLGPEWVLADLLRDTPTISHWYILLTRSLPWSPTAAGQLEGWVGRFHSSNSTAESPGGQGEFNEGAIKMS